MLFKNFSIPLCDLRLQKVGSNNEPTHIMALDQKLGDDTRMEHSETNKGLRRMRQLRSEVEGQEESDEEKEEEDYEVRKVRVVKKIVKILSDSESEDDKSEDSTSKKKVVKKRAVKETRKTIVSDFEKESNESEDSSSEEEDNSDEDPDFNIEEEEERYKNRNSESMQGVSLKSKMNSKRNLSAYEQMIEKKRAENMAFLQSLKIGEVKAGLTDIVEGVKKKQPQPVKRKYQKVETEVSPPVLRKSRRLANINIDLSEDTLYSNALKAAMESEEREEVGRHSQNEVDNYAGNRQRRRGRRPRHRRQRKKNLKEYYLFSQERPMVIPPEMSFKEALKSEDLYESYVTDVNIQESKSEARHFSYDKTVLKKMTVNDSHIAKVTPARITALTWYSSPEQLIVAAGDKYGNLGVWNVDSESNPYVFKTHLEGVTNLQFSPFNRMQLVSSSYDGILRCGDMMHHSFNEIYNISDETCCTYFDFLSATTYLVAQRNGQVALVDKRTKGKSCEKKHSCHDYSIKTVNIHPVNKNFFVTAENKGSIRLWDLRKLQTNPVADITHHKRCVHSAFFSPVTGNSILATSSDNSISIFDSTNLTSNIKMKQQMKHNNETGRWLSIFRAMWLPNSEEAFVIGSMLSPRRIEVYDKNMFVYNMMDENLTTITSTNAFHPMRAALAGANSSGKIFVFL